MAATKFAVLVSKSGRKVNPVIDPATTTEQVARNHASLTLKWWKPNEAGNPHAGFWTAAWNGRTMVACKADGGSKGAWVYTCKLTDRTESWAGLLELSARDLERKAKASAKPKASPKPKVSPALTTEPTPEA